MALNHHDRANFTTLRIAAAQGQLALIESRDAQWRYVALVCALQENPDGTITPVPFAEMVRGNPFELYADPTAGELPPATDAVAEDARVDPVRDIAERMQAELSRQVDGDGGGPGYVETLAGEAFAVLFPERVG